MAGDDRGPADGRGPDHPGKRAFLRWLDVPDSPGHAEDTRTWGQLRITTTASDGEPPTYDLRNVEDADRPVAELTTHEDPADAVDLVRFDDDGTYRPLKTAPTLPTGWVFPALGGPDLVRTVETIYPATIANWHRERESDLDVSHWRTTADRQTGIYDLVDELSREQVAWLAEACCVDAECCKRREWDYDRGEGASLAVPRGDGRFPCREPCSLVIATAREVALDARRGPDSASDEGEDASDDSLTRPEREQLARIVGAVADGEVAEIREGELGDGANRRRVRYLRAKLASNGTLPVAGAGGSDRDDDTGADH